MDESCGKCEARFSRSDVNIIPCSGFCNKVFHRWCCEGKLSEYDFKLLKGNKNLVYLCNDCLVYPKNILNQYENWLDLQKSKSDKIVEVLNESVKSLSTQIKDMASAFHTDFKNKSEKDKA